MQRRDSITETRLLLSCKIGKRLSLVFGPRSNGKFKTCCCRARDATLVAVHVLKVRTVRAHKELY